MPMTITFGRRSIVVALALALLTALVAVQLTDRAADADTPQSQFVGIDPFRTYDSRQGAGEFGKFLPGDAAFLQGHKNNQFFGAQEVVLPVEAVAASFNIAIFQTEGGTGFVEVAPCSGAEGSIATVNWDGFGQRANSSGIVVFDKTSDLTNCVRVFVDGDPGSATHFTLDITGYFI